MEAIVSDLALAFLQDNACVLCSTQIISVRGYYKYIGYSQSFPPATTGLHLSARFGLSLLLRILFKAGCQDYSIDVESKDGHGRTPLSLAAERGREAMVKLLELNIL